MCVFNREKGAHSCTQEATLNKINLAYLILYLPGSQKGSELVNFSTFGFSKNFLRHVPTNEQEFTVKNFPKERFWGRFGLTFGNTLYYFQKFFLPSKKCLALNTLYALYKQVLSEKFLAGWLQIVFSALLTERTQCLSLNTVFLTFRAQLSKLFYFAKKWRKWNA